MASAPKKKSASTGRNSDRRNGKAWKKDKFKPAKAKTPERQLKDAMVREARHRRKEANIAVRAEKARAEKILKEALKLKLAEVEAAARKKAEDAEAIRAIFHAEAYSLTI